MTLSERRYLNQKVKVVLRVLLGRILLKPTNLIQLAIVKKKNEKVCQLYLLIPQ